MRAIGTLIKMARAEVDVVQRALAEAERMHARALARIADLDTGIAREQAHAAKAASAWSTYGGYAAARADDRRALDADEAAYREHERLLRQRLSEAHVELKKLERLHELDLERQREGEARREQEALDEIATMRAARTPR